MPIHNFQVLDRKHVIYHSSNIKLFEFFPFTNNDILSPAFHLVEQELNLISPNIWGENKFYCRRNQKGKPQQLLMGFYEQNVSNNPNRIWKLYEQTNRNLLLAFKPILQFYSKKILSERSVDDLLPCPPEYGLFGTVFTAIAVNNHLCTWHIDPRDKITMLFYFGDFSGGSLLLGPPLNLNVPVQKFDCGIIAAKTIFHKSNVFEGFRFNISAFSKLTTPETVKGRLICDRGIQWALDR
ncbi:MAG: hypothetical protein V4591_06735 [Bdellovibrionota bacterium]